MKGEEKKGGKEKKEESRKKQRKCEIEGKNNGKIGKNKG
jgi:hypothetical protein